jgi:hypothetical protein
VNQQTVTVDRIDMGPADIVQAHLKSCLEECCPESAAHRTGTDD